MVKRIIKEEVFNISEIMKKFDQWFVKQSPKNQKHEKELINSWLEMYYRNAPNTIKKKIIQSISDRYNIELY